MALDAKTREAIAARAKAKGLDVQALTAAVEKMQAGANAPTEPAPTAGDATDTATPVPDRPTLFMYLLPFVTVKEVRAHMGFPGPLPGASGTEIASDWAAAHPVASPTDSTPRGQSRSAPPPDAAGTPVAPTDAAAID